MVTQYKWSLRKGGKKLRCPQCGQMRFVPFVLTADGRTMAGPEFGRCDREQSCGYFRYPDKEAKATVQVEPRPELPPALFKWDKEDMTTEETLSNTLWLAFKNILDGGLLSICLEWYRCSTGRDGSCIFPQFDGSFARTAKAIRYGEDGHRLKGNDGESLPVSWLHKSPRYKKYMESHQLKQCFFGQHLLSMYPEADVWIVEAEKTALLMATCDMYNDRIEIDRIWLACGGSQMLKGAIDLECLKGRCVTLIPDHGQYWNWKRTADAHGWACVDITRAMEARKLPAGSDVWDLKEYDLKQSKNQ